MTRSPATELHMPFIAPDTQAPAEYLKHPDVFDVTVTERSEPPVISPDGSNGDAAPKSIKNPVSFDELCHVIFVPAFIQKGTFALFSVVSAVVDAESEVLLTSTVHGFDADPQVLLLLHMLSGCATVHTLFLPV